MCTFEQRKSQHNTNTFAGLGSVHKYLGGGAGQNGGGGQKSFELPKGGDQKVFSSKWGGVIKVWSN